SDTDWTPLADHHVDALLTTAANSQYRFRPPDAMFRRALHTIAREHEIDPALERLATAEAAWDGKPRLHIWLSATCGVPPDLYHQAVSRNIVGGMVRRIRHPGCKHDLMAVLYGPQ